MQKCFIVFLKSRPNRYQPGEEANRWQEKHMAHLRKMYELSYADPMVKAGRLKIETHSWWAAKEIFLR